jgi:hypothetical protein
MTVDYWATDAIGARGRLDLLTFGKRVVSLLDPLTTRKSQAKT